MATVKDPSKPKLLAAVALAVFVAALSAAALATFGGEARAANFTVNSTDDAPDANPGDGECRTSEDECTLRAAIQESNANETADVVTVPAGEYALAVANGGVQTEDEAATGDLDLTGEISINGAGASSTTVNASGIDRAFDARPEASASISGLTVTGGSAQRGGGLLNEGRLTLEEVAVSGNDADFGGAADNFGGVLTLRRSSVSSNAAVFGGGLYNENGGDLRVSASTVSGNEAQQDGGGVYTNTAAGEITNSTIGENSADEGGGIYSEFSSLEITNSTVNANDAPSGGNVASEESEVLATNTIVSGATDGEAAGENCSAPLDSGGGNLDSGDTCGFVLASDDEDADPLLGDLQNNGGPTNTYALGGGSPAIDGGINGPCPGADQRGVERPRDGDGNGSFLCDVGAFEAPGPLPPPPSSPSPGNPPRPNPNACTIVGTPGNDRLVGTPGRDVICGLGGNDIIRGLGGNDRLIGGPGNDTIYGGAGSDVLIGGPGRDVLRGEGGSDLLDARDRVRGNDVTDGGPGRDGCRADPRDIRRNCP